MAERDKEPLRPSLLDRLMAGESGASQGVYEYVGLRELRASVARDLEWLLNTKLPDALDLSGFQAARESILAWGVPDFSTYSWRSSGDAEAISRVLETTIRRFEPRLIPRTVKVEVTPGGDVDDFTLSFRIDAVLNVDPIREAVSFDTDIDFESTAVHVSGES